MRFRLLLTAFALVLAACSGSSADDTTTTTAAATTSEATTTTVEDTTTTTEAATTTTEETTTTTTEPEDTTTTSEGEGDTTTTSEGTEDTTTTTAGEGDTSTTSFPPPPTTSSTTIAEAIAELEEWAGVFRQPTAFPNFVQFRADGVLRAGGAFDNMPFEGTWDYDSENDAFIFDIDVGGITCGGVPGTYSRDTAPGGGRLLTVVDDPCVDRVAFFTLPDSDCLCMNWLEVVEPDDE